MSAMTLPAPAPAVGPSPGGGITRILLSEWTKVRTLRSTVTTFLVAIGISLALGAAVSASRASEWDTMSPTQRANFDPTSAALVGVMFTSIILGSLAIRMVTTEYSSGMIRATFAATPRRRTVLAVKAAILAVAVFPVALVGNVGAFLIGQGILASKGIEASISDPGVLRALAFGALAVSLTALVGVGLGGLIRKTSAATAALSLAIIGSQIFGSSFPSGVRKILPGFALQSVVGVQQSIDLLTPAAGLMVLAVYGAVIYMAASVLIARRDA